MHPWLKKSAVGPNTIAFAFEIMRTKDFKISLFSNKNKKIQ